MKKIIIAAAIMLATSVLPSLTRQVNVKTATVTFETVSTSFRKDLGTAD